MQDSSSWAAKVSFLWKQHILGLTGSSPWKKKKEEDLGQLKQHDLVWWFFFFSVIRKLKRIKMPLCQPEALRIWPHGQVKDCFYTRSSLILR